MPRHSANLPAFLDAGTFPTWVEGVHNAMIAAGAKQTADTGQLGANPAIPGAINTDAGSRVYQIGPKFFTRVFFGVGGAIDRPRLAWQVGHGTNGAGALTDNVLGRYQTPAASVTAGVTRAIYASGDGAAGSGNGSFLAIIVNVDPAANASLGILLEAQRGADGNPDGSGLIQLGIGSVQATQHLCLPAGTQPGESITGAVVGNDYLIAATAADVPLMPVLWGIGRVNASKGVFAYRHADMPELTPVGANIGGVARTVLPLGDGARNIAGAGTLYPAIAWDA